MALRLSVKEHHISRSINNAVVLGGAGFIGSWLVDHLQSEGISTLVVDRGAGSALADIDLTRVVEERSADVVFHLAGSASVPASVEHPLDDLSANGALTLSVLESLRKVPNPPVLLFVSSAAVYGDARDLPMAEDHEQDPVSPYGISKMAAERYVSLYARLYGMRTLSVRPFSIYGPGQRKQVIYDLLTRAIGGESPLKVLGSPEVSRDFVYVGDVVRALLNLARRSPAEGEAYNLCSGRETRLGDLVAALLEASNSSAEASFTGDVRPGDPLRWVGDPSRAAALGVECATSLDAGLWETAEWVRGRPARPSALGAATRR